MFDDILTSSDLDTLPEKCILFIKIRLRNNDRIIRNNFVFRYDFTAINLVLKLSDSRIVKNVP